MIFASGLLSTAATTSLFSIIDIILALTNVKFLFLSYSMKIPVEALWKKEFTKLHFSFESKLRSSTWLSMLTGNNTPLLFIAIFLLLSLKHDNSDNQQASIMWRLLITGYCILCNTSIEKASSFLYQHGTDKILELEHEQERDAIINYQPPSLSISQALIGTPYDLVGLKTDLSGIENLNLDAPSLFVANHTLWGVDMGPLINSVYQQTSGNVYLRGLADHAHFGLPHGEVLRYFGAVDGTRSNVDTLMKSKQNVLVYPGGQQEVLKHSSIKPYDLLWKQRLGFVKMAIKYGYPITPVSCVGVEDMLKIMYDMPVGSTTIPITYPINPMKLQKLYFYFGKPITTTQYFGDYQNNDYAIELRDKVKAAVQDGVKMLLQKQRNDPERYLTQQLASKVNAVMCGSKQTETASKASKLEEKHSKQE